jgi:hypothetical protein
MKEHGNNRPPAEREREVLEAQRAPAGNAAAGEQPGKRNSDERNDPASEEGTRSGLAETAPRAFTIVHDGDGDGDETDNGDADSEAEPAKRP